MRLKEKIKAKVRAGVVRVLTLESKLILNKFKPEIIAVTGNVGKTTTKDFIYGVLRGGSVRAAQKSQNSEFGVCLTILGADNAWDSMFGWLKILTIGFVKSYFGNLFGEKYPKTLVLEIGADHPGDIKHLTTFIKPNTVVLTAFQKTPTHGEFFKTIDQHIREKKYLAEALVDGGNLIFNVDDEVMTKMANEVGEKKRIRKYGFGKSEDAQVQILESENYYDVDNVVEGTKVKLLLGEYATEMRLKGVLGEAQNYSLAAAALVGVLKGQDKEQIKNAFVGENWKPTKSRMRILRGINNSVILDDSYNASPVAVENALETLRKTFVKGRKVVVLGHMAELGEKTRETHLQMGKLAAEVADVIIFSGRCNEHYLDGLRDTKFNMNKVFLAENANKVNEIIYENNLLNENDLLLAKGSQSARLEKTVVEFLFDKRDADDVCRQDAEWAKR
jgi:UDP-N-acetylmuramoyl-tripeptide--D-alanyl-D-alanine ligase